MSYSFDTIYASMASMVTASSGSTNVVLSDRVSWYQVNAAVDTTINISTASLSSMPTNPVIMFYLKLDIPTPVTSVSWPSSVSWLNGFTPVMNAGGRSYILLFSSFDSGTTWVGSKVGSFATPSP